MKLSSGIKSVLLTFLEDELIISSWGLSCINITSNILRFNVDGIKYKGIVSIEALNDSDYIVTIGEQSYNVKGTKLIKEFIDEQIECSDNYTLDLERWLNL
jgi:hypothetical protein